MTGDARASAAAGGLMTGPIVVLGDSLLDVDIEGHAERLCPDAPAPVVDGRSECRRPGGAGLAALLAARDGAEVVLVTAIGNDASGRCLASLLADHVEVVRLPLRGATVRKTRVRVRGRTLIRIDTGDGRARGSGGDDRCPYRTGHGGLRYDLAGGWPGRSLAGERVAAVLRSARAVLVSDYGRGVAELCRDLLRDLAAPVVWDPHPRGAPPAPGCALVTPSEAEARLLCAEPRDTPDRIARYLVRDLGAEAVAVTLAERGTVLARRGGRPLRIPPPALVTGRDSCGAGDRFATAATLALAEGASTEDAVAAAVGEATRFVERGGAAAVRLPRPARRRRSPVPRTDVPPAPAPGPESLAGAVRAAGGRLIATGGCFDLLHAGHVSLLRRARALGDALIVCVNSDESVRRLKGRGRPVVGERDRVEVLRALECVDAVAVFDGDTPCALIGHLRPDVWVKGGDYTGREMPETEAVWRAGGDVVILPSVPGHSTTGLIAAARRLRDPEPRGGSSRPGGLHDQGDLTTGGTS
ncbi:D-glycero-beta-D-manno-heptose 1-phosphate adenylyltransferase [Streptosporangium sp. NPDC002721]|uniref:D-glycero-beta-D-manno-heptose 1-phosphate adenylyltransferase n=1 Tax=Streptosporangium sp. NPDC002721 TaxID=3366188 RepID=UPI00369088DF